MGMAEAALIGYLPLSPEYWRARTSLVDSKLAILSFISYDKLVKLSFLFCPNCCKLWFLVWQRQRQQHSFKLDSVLNYLYCCGAHSHFQSLVIPFAFLINNQPDTILSLLESININGRSGLHILIQTWCENAETFQGFWPPRISTLALTKLFASGRPSLQNLMVKGDLIVKAETKNSEYEMSS